MQKHYVKIRIYLGLWWSLPYLKNSFSDPSLLSYTRSSPNQFDWNCWLNCPEVLIVLKEAQPSTLNFTHVGVCLSKFEVPRRLIIYAKETSQPCNDTRGVVECHDFARQKPNGFFYTFKCFSLLGRHRLTP